MTLKKSLFFSFVLVLAGCGSPISFPVPGVEPTGAFSITGVVYNGTGPATLAGATVQLFGPVNRTTTSQSGGTYAFSGLPAGEYRVEASLEGFYIYSQGTNVDSRITVDGVESRDFHSVSFSPSGDAFSIPEIQGETHLSPLLNEPVTNVVGVVTAVEFQDYYQLDFPWYGIYLQNLTPDGNEKTSEGLFVYIPLQDTSFTVTVGSLVNIKSGIVEENRYDFSFLDFGYDGNLSRTWIKTSKDNVQILVAGSGTGDPKIPPAVAVGVTPAAGKRIIPPLHAEASGNIESDDWNFDPKLNAVDFWESLEGMRVTMSNLKVVEPTSEYGDLYVSPDNGVGVVLPNTHGGALLNSYSEANARTIQIIEYSYDYPSVYAAIPDVGVGGSITTATGIVDYSRNTYMVRTMSIGSASGGVSAQETTSLSGDATHLTVGTTNLQNFWAEDTRAGGLGTVISDRMGRPDIVGLVEVQDNTGEQDDGTVAADLSLQALITGIGGSPAYIAREVSPLNNRNGGAPGANIRTAFLYRTDRVSFIDRAASGIDTSSTSVQVVAGATGPQLSWSPGLIGAGESLFDYTRKALVGEFLFNGKKVFVITAHLNSKIGDGSFWGPYQPILRPSEEKRHQRAEYIADFIRQIKAIDPEARVVMVGDYNDFHFSRTLGIFAEAGLYNLHNVNPIGERYTYYHLGNAQSLDHILVTNNLVSGAALDVVRVYRNIAHDDALSLSDHEPVVARIYIP